MSKLPHYMFLKYKNSKLIVDGYCGEDIDSMENQIFAEQRGW